MSAPAAAARADAPELSLDALDLDAGEVRGACEAAGIERRRGRR